MRKTLSVVCLTLLILAMMDVAVAGVLGWAESRGQLSSLVRYFEYGRSVPGKLERWENNPEVPGNLYDVAWREAALEQSAADFLAEPQDVGPIVRSYGNSFVNNILRFAQEIDGSLRVEAHAGPGAPPNYTFAQFLDDRANRREGDIVVLGVLSSSVAAMAALSNQTWAFEQPAPFTYPVFHVDGTALRRVEPLIETAAQHRRLGQDAELARDWSSQLSREDAFYSPVAFGASWLDASPFARLVRRSLATSHIQRTKARIIHGQTYPFEDVLVLMARQFAETARADGQIPVVMLIQSRDAGDPDLLAIAGPALESEGIAFLATAAYFDPRDQSGFLGDGHYVPAVDRKFAQAFIDLLSTAR